MHEADWGCNHPCDHPDCGDDAGSIPVMPEVVASHWNAAGDLEGTLPKFWGLVLIPVLMFGFCALLVVLRRIDPLRDNYWKFQNYYEGFILIFAAFFFFIQLEIILWGRGIFVSPNLTMPVMIGILFIYVGFLLEHAIPTWFVGIRTPWTLRAIRYRRRHTRRVQYSSNWPDW